MKKIIISLLLVVASITQAHLPPHIPRLSSYPYISGDTFRFHSDIIFEWNNQDIDYDAMQSGTIVFVKRDLLDNFFELHHDNIPYPYILLTHNGDEDITQEYDSYLNDSKIIVWFGQNVNYAHPKLIPLPLGIANRYWQHGNTDLIGQIRQKALRGYYTKRHLIYVNFNIATCPDTRKQVFEHLVKEPYCYQAHRKPFHNYLEDLAESYFIASPRGNGIDCHRTWEAILMGSIPIIESSHLDFIFKDLPVLIIDDWSCITKEYLEEQYKIIHNTTYNLDKLFVQFWLDLIDSYKP